MEFMIYVWLGIICVGLLVEGLNAGTLVSVWFAVGAVVPMIMSFWEINSVAYLTAQIIVFGVVTSLCLIFLRGITKKILFRNKDERTNLDLMVGQHLKVVRMYDEVPYIKFNGIEYRVVIQDDEDVQVNDLVELVRFEGNKAIAKKIK